MSIADALNKWTEGCTAEEAKGQIIRNGNWQPLARALRHCKEKTSIEEAGKLNGDTVLAVTPDSPLGLPKFLLVVK
jgi:hypothetical protein